MFILKNLACRTSNKVLPVLSKLKYMLIYSLKRPKKNEITSVANTQCHSKYLKHIRLSGKQQSRELPMKKVQVTFLEGMKTFLLLFCSIFPLTSGSLKAFL